MTDTASPPVTIAQLRRQARELGIAATGSKVELEQRIQEAQFGRHFVGSWAGKPNYGCPACQFRTLEGSAAVDEHIHSVHVVGEPRRGKARRGLRR